MAIASRYYTKGVTGNRIKPNGGSFVGYTSISSTQTNITAKVNVGDSSKRFSPGHVPNPGAASGITTVYGLSSGTYAKMTKGQYLAYRLTTQIAGIPNVILRAGTSQIGLQRPINKLEAIRTRQQRAAGWSYVTGQLLSVPSVTNDTFKSIDGTGNIDQAARPTRAVPGEFVYLTASKTPIQRDYPARTL